MSASAFATIVVGGDGPTVTRGYIWQLYYHARAFVIGWRACHEEDTEAIHRDAPFATSQPDPTYADVRDFLRSEYDVDYLSACQVALVLTRPARTGWQDPVNGREFQPVV